MPLRISEGQSTDTDVDVESPHKKRADSVAPSNVTGDEDSSELTLVGEDVVVDKAKGQ